MPRAEARRPPNPTNRRAFLETVERPADDALLLRSTFASVPKRDAPVRPIRHVNSLCPCTSRIARLTLRRPRGSAASAVPLAVVINNRRVWSQSQHSSPKLNPESRFISSSSTRFARPSCRPFKNSAQLADAFHSPPRPPRGAPRRRSTSAFLSSRANPPRLVSSTQARMPKVSKKVVAAVASEVGPLGSYVDGLVKQGLTRALGPGDRVPLEIFFNYALFSLCICLGIFTASRIISPGCSRAPCPTSSPSR